MSNERRKIVLNAIVRDYVATREPVGSKGVVERHNLGVSPATVRNDMAHLEEAGLIVQPHTSAGRIPTDAGYREFVDAIAEIKPLSRGEKNAIARVLNEAVDLDDVLARATNLLSRITSQVALVQYPSLRRTALRHVELLALGEYHVLVVIITDAGRVEQRTISTAHTIAAHAVATIRQTMNEEYAGKQLSELADAADQVIARLVPEHAALAKQIAVVVEETLAEELEERVVVAGRQNLTKYDADFHGSIRPMLDVLEEQVVLMRMLADEEEGLRVHIGRENGDEQLAETSIVTAPYASGIARVGVVGPTRMDYYVNMAGVQAVATYLSDILGTKE